MDPELDRDFGPGPMTDAEFLHKIRVSIDDPYSDPSAECACCERARRRERDRWVKPCFVAYLAAGVFGFLLMLEYAKDALRWWQS
jgi:hypothetical protein